MWNKNKSNKNKFNYIILIFTLYVLRKEKYLIIMREGLGNLLLKTDIKLTFFINWFHIVCWIFFNIYKIEKREGERERKKQRIIMNCKCADTFIYFSFHWYLFIIHFISMFMYDIYMYMCIWILFPFELFEGIDWLMDWWLVGLDWLVGWLWYDFLCNLFFCCILNLFLCFYSIYINLL